MNTQYNMLIGTEVSGTSFQKELNAIPLSQRTVTVAVKADGSKEMTTLYNTGNNVIKMSSQLNSSGQAVDNTFKSMKTSFSNTGKQASLLSGKFVDIIKKVTAFGLATQVIGLFTSALREAVTVVKEMDVAMTEFSKVSDKNSDYIDEYTKKLGDLGTEVARTTKEMLEASTQFVKSGYTEEQSAQLAKVASLYQNIADSEIDAGTSASLIISQMKAFNMTASESELIIDKINEVSNSFAVSSTDVSSALTKSSSALSTYGNDINETIGLVTAG